MTQRQSLVLHKTLGPPAIRISNRASLLEAIRRNNGISRAELVALTGLTQAAISNIVVELMAMGLVEEAGLVTSGGGRPRVQLVINPDACYVVGVDLARSAISAGIVDLNGTIRHSLRAASTLIHPIDITIARLVDLLEQLLAAFGSARSKIVGIGIGAPGPLSASEGVIVSPPNFAAWRNVPLKKMVEAHFRLPVWIDNDANACALAEAWFGAGRPFEQFVYIAVGTGVGAGIVVNGTVHRGANDMAGELGHTTVDMTGPRCNCGNYGCLELYTSAVAIVSAALMALQNGESSLIHELVQGEWANINVGIIAQAARRNDPLARRLIDQVVRYLGVGVVNSINLFNPEAVFLGREVAQAAGDLLLDPIRAMVAERAFSVAAERVQILPAMLGANEPVIGAACLVLQELFSAPEMMMTPILQKA